MCCVSSGLVCSLSGEKAACSSSTVPFTLLPPDNPLLQLPLNTLPQGLSMKLQPSHTAYSTPHADACSLGEYRTEAVLHTSFPWRKLGSKKVLGI